MASAKTLSASWLFGNVIKVMSFHSGNIPHGAGTRERDEPPRARRDVDVRADGEPSANWRNRKQFQSRIGSHFYSEWHATLFHARPRFGAIAFAGSVDAKTLADFSPTAPDLQCSTVGLVNFVQVQNQPAATTDSCDIGFLRYRRERPGRAAFRVLSAIWQRSGVVSPYNQISSAADHRVLCLVFGRMGLGTH